MMRTTGTAPSFSFSYGLRLLLLGLTLISLLITTYQAQADWVEVSGSAQVRHQDLVSARRAAIRDALRQASLQGGAVVNSHQQMTDGAISRDNVSVSTMGYVDEMTVLSEEVRDGIMYVTVKANLTAQEQTCQGGGYANGYRRSLAVTNFYLQTPEEAKMGDLFDISEKLPQELLRRLQGQRHLRMLDASQYQMYNSLDTIPTSISDRGTLTNAVEASNRLGAQYVLSGVIREMGMEHPELAGERPFFDGLVERVRYQDERFARRFAVDLYIHDGFSGTLVATHHFETGGNWNINRLQKVGFASPAFWNTDYGQHIDALIEQMVSGLEDEIGCQPFMARITRTDGKKLYIDTGADAGLKPGDTLNVYRLSTFYDNTQREFVEMQNVDMVMTVDRVQPRFSRGTIAALPIVENIQQGDIVVAW